MQIKEMGAGDFFAVQYWLELRDRKPWRADEVPKMAWVISDGDQLVACAMIRRVEGGHGQLDGLCTNPSLPGEIRHKAIDALVTHAIQAAYDSGIKHLYALSVDESTLLRSQKHGFVRAPHTVIVHSPKGAA